MWNVRAPGREAQDGLGVTSGGESRRSGVARRSSAADLAAGDSIQRGNDPTPTSRAWIRGAMVGALLLSGGAGLARRALMVAEPAAFEMFPRPVSAPRRDLAAMRTDVAGDPDLVRYGNFTVTRGCSDFFEQLPVLDAPWLHEYLDAVTTAPLEAVRVRPKMGCLPQAGAAGGHVYGQYRSDLRELHVYGIRQDDAPYLRDSCDNDYSWHATMLHEMAHAAAAEKSPSSQAFDGLIARANGWQNREEERVGAVMTESFFQPLGLCKPMRYTVHALASVRDRRLNRLMALFQWRKIAQSPAELMHSEPLTSAEVRGLEEMQANDFHVLRLKMTPHVSAQLENAIFTHILAVRRFAATPISETQPKATLQARGTRLEATTRELHRELTKLDALPLTQGCRLVHTTADGIRYFQGISGAVQPKELIKIVGSKDPPAHYWQPARAAASFGYAPEITTAQNHEFPVMTYTSDDAQMRMIVMPLEFGTADDVAQTLHTTVAALRKHRLRDVNIVLNADNVIFAAPEQLLQTARTILERMPHAGVINVNIFHGYNTYS